MLTTGKGATLSAAGFDSVEAPRSVSAIAAHVWAHLALLPARSDSATCGRPFFCAEGGHLALGELLEGARTSSCSTRRRGSPCPTSSRGSRRCNKRYSSRPSKNFSPASRFATMVDDGPPPASGTALGPEETPRWARCNHNHGGLHNAQWLAPCTTTWLATKLRPLVRHRRRAGR